jgi:hypothetical protein
MLIGGAGAGKVESRKAMSGIDRVMFMAVVTMCTHCVEIVFHKFSQQFLV